MKDYITKISELDNSDSDELISNGSKEHAQALIYQFFDNAKRTVNITSKGLSLYNNTDIVNALSAALNNGVKVKVLLDDYQGGTIKDNMFLDKCWSNQGCEVRTYSKPLKAHIITRDSAAFRYCDNPGSNIAVASFNRPDVVENATNKVFGSFFDSQTEYVQS